MLFWFIYIPIWFYFNSISKSLSTVAYFIYIPIWFYFNESDFTTVEATSKFTFQYGSTLILLINIISYFYFGIYIPIWFYFNKIMPWFIPLYFIEFTFQYGSTLIIIYASHSITIFRIYIPIWFYFNNYEVLAKYDIKFDLHSNMVLL